MANYLITGGAGFIGSHLSEELLRLKHKVSVIDDLSTGRIENIAHLLGNPLFSFARASITDEIVLDRIASQANIIIHLAAAVGVKLIVEKPVQTIETNVIGTEFVLKSALKYRCKVLIASTSEVYGKGFKIPFGESDDILLGPTTKNRWAYAASKMLDEFLALAYHKEYGLETIIMRFFNTVGTRQTGEYGMVIPRFISQAMHNQPISVFSDGLMARCFCNVKDVIQAVIGLSEDTRAVGEVLNIGSKDEIVILELAKKIRQITNSRSEIQFIPYAEVYNSGFEDMQRRVPDTSKIEAMLNWAPTVSLQETIEEIYAFEKSKQV